MSKYASITCWIIERANRFLVFIYINAETQAKLWVGSKTNREIKWHRKIITSRSAWFRLHFDELWQLSKFFFSFLLVPLSSSNVCAMRWGFSHQNRLSCHTVFFFWKTWRKLMVLCNISSTCWIIYSPHSMHTHTHTHARELMC